MIGVDCTDERASAALPPTPPVLQVLHSLAWRLLQERIGDELMLHMLLHTSIFVPLRNNNYLQVAGKPIHEVRQCGGGEGERWARAPPM